MTEMLGHYLKKTTMFKQQQQNNSRLWF